MTPGEASEPARAPGPQTTAQAVGDAADPLPPALEVGGEEKMPSVPPKAAAPVEADPASAFQTQKAGLEIYFDESQRLFWTRNKGGRWVDLGEGGLKRLLKKELGLRDKPNPGKAISPLDEEVSRIENDSRIAYGGLLAGYRAGMHLIAGRMVLVTEDPIFIEPVAGAWPVLEQIFAGLFVGEEPLDDKGAVLKIDQRPQFFSWLRHAVQCYRACRRARGLALGIAGEPDCGKSFLAWILRQIFGGRVGKPYETMIGDEKFNRDTVECSLQLIDDENQGDTDFKSRQKFTSEVKKFVANNEVRLRAMHRDGFSVEVMRRLVILVNLQGILVLPPLDGDVDDKLMLLKAYTRPRPGSDRSTWFEGRPTVNTPPAEACWPMPLPTRTEEEQEELRGTVLRELPAFLFWLLNEFNVPSELTGGRLGGVRHWHHPAIVTELRDLSPDSRLWDLIVRAKVVFNESYSDSEGLHWRPRDEWKGDVGELEQLLKKHGDSQLSLDEKKEVPTSNWLGRRLKLCEKHLGKVNCRLEGAGGSRVWVLRPRDRDKQAKRAN